MKDHNFAGERLEIRRMFNDLMLSLRMLHRHKLGYALLDDEEVEFHSMNVSISMHEVETMVEEQLSLLDPEKTNDGHDNESRSGKEGRTPH